MPSSQPPPGSPVIFRASARPYVVVAAFATPLLGLACLVGWKKGDWALAEIFLGMAVLLCGLSWFARLRFDAEGVAWRTLKGVRSVLYADVDRAVFATILVNGVPTGAAFQLQLRDGSRAQPALRAFPIQAAALLLDRLESRGVPIEPPHGYHAERMATEIERHRARPNP